MKKNMNDLDRIVRTFIAIVFAVLYFTEIVSGVLGVMLTVLSGIFALTSFISFCPIYTVFGISTCKVKEQ